MSAIIIDSEIIHYEVLGRGRPLIFLHGWIGSWRYWIPAMQKASTGFRAYALDLWGFGDTAKAPENYLLDKQVNLVRRFLHELGIGKVVFIGHGLGAIISILFAQEYPQSVDRLLAIGFPFAPDQINSQFQNASSRELVDWLSPDEPGMEAARAEAPKTDPQAITSAIVEIKTRDLLHHVRAIRAPCLFVHGQHDPAFAHPDQAFIANLAANNHLITFESSGHFPMLEEVNKFNRLMVDFLALESGDSPRNLQLKEEWKRRVR